jgi:hydrogenase maturation protein HypF
MARLDEETGARGRVRRRFEVTGLVQGVGFRPYVYTTAADLSLTGWVGNHTGGVAVEVEGAPSDVARFGERLARSAPPLARVDSVREVEQDPRGGTGFRIEASAGSGAVRTLVSPDVAACEECLREVRDPAGRRYRYPFTTCTNCGPRFTIVTGLPYDRARTTMAHFALCGPCRQEYDDPSDRRFHAQPLACPDCGPTLRLVGKDGPDVRGEEAMTRARSLLGQGRILAVKGLGGYHLTCDAGDERAVAELRRRKRRGDKPFAVMAADLATARTAVGLEGAEALLTGVRRATPTSGSCCPTHPCTCCCSASRATPRDHDCW